MDTSPVLFIPYIAVVASTLVAAPVATVRYARWRIRANLRTKAGHCGHCDAPFTLGEEQFLVTGVRICSSCASTLRHRLGRALMGISVGVLSLGALAVGAVAVEIAVDGTDILRWLFKSSRWIPVAIPSVGVALGVSALVTLAKQANRVGRGRVPAALAADRERLLPLDGI